MINIIKITTNLFNFVLLGSLLIYTTLFYFLIIKTFLSNFIIIIGIISLFFKILNWYIIDKFSNKFNQKNKSRLLLLRIGFCIFLYIVPVYYIIQYPFLIVSNNIILTTLIIISILTFITIISEKYLSIFKSVNFTSSIHEKK